MKNYLEIETASKDEVPVFYLGFKSFSILFHGREKCQSSWCKQIDYSKVLILGTLCECGSANCLLS